jgi:hypothetical protein
MRLACSCALFALLALMGSPASLAARQPAVTPPPAPAAEAREPRLMFEREVFNYRGRVRRDPFAALTAAAEGPLFSEIRLHMIIHSDVPGESIAALSVSNGRRIRLRRGESVGNATIIDIGPSRVVFSVTEFGMRRQEVLDLKPPREGE